MDLEDRMPLLLQLAFCFLAFLTEVEGVLRSVEKVQVLVDPVVLKTLKERRMRSLSIPIPPFSCLLIQLSDEVFPPICSAWIQGKEEYVQQSGGRMSNPVNRVLGRTPFCPPLPPKARPDCLLGFAKASGYYDAEHHLPAALCPRKETEFDLDNTHNWNFHGSTWFAFVYPSRGFCSAEVTALLLILRDP